MLMKIVDAIIKPNLNYQDCLIKGLIQKQVPQIHTSITKLNIWPENHIPIDSQRAWDMSPLDLCGRSPIAIVLLGCKYIQCFIKLYLVLLNGFGLISVMIQV